MIRRNLPAREVHARLRSALTELRRAEKNAVLWFAEVVERKLYRELGYSTIHQYAETALGFSTSKTYQFLRLCASFSELPELKRSVEAGSLSWTKARVVARVATPESESHWIAEAGRSSRRELEEKAQTTRRRAARERAENPDQGRLAVVEGGRSGPTAAQAVSGRPGAGGKGIVPGSNAPLPEGGKPDRVTRKDPATGAVATSGRGWKDSVPTQGASTNGLITIGADTRENAPPVEARLRFFPEDYAQIEAMLEKLRKLGVKGRREELILAGLWELLAVTAGAIRDDEAKPSTPPTGERPPEGPSPGRFRSGESPLQESHPSGDIPPERPPSAKPSSSSGKRPGDCTRVQTAGTAESDPERSGADRAKENAVQLPRPVASPYQVVVQLCPQCESGEVAGSGGPRKISPAALRAILCDARVQRPGRRNRSTIPPALRARILARDRYTCRVAGCGGTRFLHVHHLHPKEFGGPHRESNLISLCSSCHKLVHEMEEQRSQHPCRGGTRLRRF